MRKNRNAINHNLKHLHLILLVSVPTTSLSLICTIETPTGVIEATRYAGLVYYEDLQDLVTFTAAKDLNALLEVSVQLFVIE